MAELLVRDMGKLRESLAEAARTDESTIDRVVARFIELRPGIDDKLGARRHHMLTGRRGTGKSTLLHVVRKRLEKKGVAVATVDMERFKGREFPDVLIEILIALLAAMRPEVRFKHLWPDQLLKSRETKLRKELLAALNDPQSLTRRIERTASRKSKLGVGGSGAAAWQGVGFKSTGGIEHAKDSTSIAAAQYEELKIQRLQQLAPRISEVLKSLVDRTAEKYALIFIDDYYFVRLADQPNVLGYLHQVCKGTGVWLKIGGVGSRLNPFVDGDPPVGMQLTQDMDGLALDVTLDDFATAQGFLEKMLDGVMEPHGISTPQLFTDESRNRMVLACGGAVARDYITLTDDAIDEAVERMSKAKTYKEDAVVRITSADVQRAVRKRMNNKEQESLGLDAGADAGLLSARWRDICDFIRESGEIVFILVKQADLDGTTWGKEVQQLENLRLLHRIKDAIPNTMGWRGIKTMVFMVDLGQIANQRLRTKIPEFWKSTAEFDKLRRAEWVYSPGWRESQTKAAKKNTASDAKVDKSLRGSPPDTLF